MGNLVAQLHIPFPSEETDPEVHSSLPTSNAVYSDLEVRILGVEKFFKSPIS